MSWAILLLQDPKTLQTYEDYAKESAYEADGDQPPPPNPPNHRHQNQDTHSTRPKRTVPINYGQAGTSIGATGMDVDPDPQGQTTRPGKPFNNGYASTTTRGNTSADSTGGVYTENFVTPLYTESQETGHTNVNTGQRTPEPIRTYLEAIRDAEISVAAAAAAAKAEVSAETAGVEMEATKVAAAEVAAKFVTKQHQTLQQRLKRMQLEKPQYL